MRVPAVAGAAPVIDVAARFALGPMLLAQANALRASALQLPEAAGERTGRVGSGEVVLRLLVAGDSSAAGVGVATQDEAVALPLARHLARHIKAGVRWQLVAQSGLTSEGILEELKSSTVDPCDLAVVVCGVNDITHQRAVRNSLRVREHIVDWLRSHCGVRHVVFPALPEMEKFPSLKNPLAWYAGQLSRRNNRAQANWAATRAHISHAQMNGVADSTLFAEDGYHPGPVLYGRVAERLAEHIMKRVWADLQGAPLGAQI
jgi:lysophospholipase L1-like esterase